MSSTPTLRPLSRPFLQALRRGGLLCVLGGSLCLADAWAADGARRSYQIPAGSLASALTRYAERAGVSLSVEPSLVAGRDSAGLNGEYAVEEGFEQLLRGSGLVLQPLGEGAYTVQPQPEAAVQTLPGTAIVGLQPVGAGGDLYAGGQVVRTGSQGLLGEQDFMDTPFNVTSYTGKTAQDQQARTLGDMVANDPSVRTTNPAGGRFEQFSVRGFSLFNSDVAYGGLYGVLPTYSIDMEMVERVDILKGPGALLGGIAPRGSVGGSINIEPKRAGDEPLTEFTGSYASAGQFGGHVDIGRRFGEDQRFGLRFNGVRQSGDTEWDHQSVEREASVVGFDIRGERARMSLDLGHTERTGKAPIERVELRDGVRVPKAEDIHRNIAQHWTYADSRDTFGALRGELDVNDSLMVYAAIGARKGTYDFLRHTVRRTDNNGNFEVQPRTFQRDEQVRTATVGARNWFSTGPVSHTLNLSLNRYYMEFDNNGTRYPIVTSNLYDPINYPEPTGAPIRVDDPTHTENVFTSLALADTLGFADDQVLLTLGARLQRVKVDNWTSGVRDQRYDEQVTSPALGLVVKASERLSLYANYMEGLTQGETAPTSAGLSNSGEIFPPYQAKQAEVGAKYDMGTFSASLSLFRIEQPSYVTEQNRFRPDGELRNQGIELNLFGEPVEGVRLLGGVMLLDSEQTRTANGQYDGNRGTGAPVANVNLGAEWDIGQVPGLTLTARGIHTGSQYLDAANQQKIDSWERYDLGARYAFRLGDNPITLRANVENVLDKTYWASAAASSDSAPGLTLSTPRTYQLSATIGF